MLALLYIVSNSPVLASFAGVLSQDNNFTLSSFVSNVNESLSEPNVNLFSQEYNVKYGS